MREHLLGYVLGALDDSEQDLVKQHLEANEELAGECQRVKDYFHVLRSVDDHHMPPAGLAMQTLSLVAHSAKTRVSTGINDDSAPKVSLASPPGMRRGREGHGAGQSKWSLADMVVAAGVCAAAAMLFFPAIANSRQKAAIAQCQNNLRQIGTALTQYSEHNNDTFPEVAASGPRSAAGVYAPLLKHAGYLTNDASLLCPTSTIAQQRNNFHVPKLDDLDSATGEALKQLQQNMGGSYGYALGHIDENGEYRPTRNRHRSTFGLVADAPSEQYEGTRSANHSGSGQNVLMEDDSVRYVTSCTLGPNHDNVYRSDRGFVEAGRHVNDSVIAASSATPLLHRVSNSQ